MEPSSGTRETPKADGPDRTLGRNYRGAWRRTPGRLLGIGAVRFYQIVFSPFVGGHCRHVPTCSEYAYEAVARHGLPRGAWLTGRRVLRCGPFGKPGLDPVPETLRRDRR